MNHELSSVNQKGYIPQIVIHQIHIHLIANKANLHVRAYDERFALAALYLKGFENRLVFDRWR